MDDGYDYLGTSIMAIFSLKTLMEEKGGWEGVRGG
jgi:hypothetical protein